MLDRIRVANVGGLHAGHVHEHCLGKIIALEVHFPDGSLRAVHGVFETIMLNITGLDG